MPLPTAGGIGGQAAVECLVEIPIGVAGINGLVRFTVLKDSNDCATPPLLPISSLETIEASIYLLVAGNGNTAPMRRLPTRHRATSILNFADNKWSLPVQHRKDPAIDPFEIPRQSPANRTTSFWLQPQDCVSVWLLRNDVLMHVQDAPERHT